MIRQTRSTRQELDLLTTKGSALKEDRPSRFGKGARRTARSARRVHLKGIDHLDDG
jgi:hypothetical protein